MYLNSGHMAYSSSMHIIKSDCQTCKADASGILQGLMLDTLVVEGIVVSISWCKWHFATNGADCQHNSKFHG